jgi:hypothetical protein
MKPKTIEKILINKFEDFLKSIKDDQLRLELKTGCIITGGCITSFLLGEDVNDYDIYFTTQDLTVKVAQYYVEQFGEL